MIRRSIWLLLFFLIPCGAGAQTAASRKAQLERTVREAMADKLRLTLHEFIRQEAHFFARNGRYAAELSALPQFKPERGIVVRIVGIHPAFQGYAAEASIDFWGSDAGKARSPVANLTCVTLVGEPGTPVPQTSTGKRPRGMINIVCDAIGPS